MRFPKTLAAVVGLTALSPAAAHGGFVLTTTRAPSTADPTKDVVKFFALNNGLDASGTKLQTGQITLTSIAAPLVFEVKDLDFDGANDVNILGQGITSAQANPPGSFIRIGTNPANFNVVFRSPEDRSDPNGDGTPDGNPVTAYTGLKSFRVDGSVLTNPPAANLTPVNFATALVPTNTGVAVTARLFGDAGGGFDVTLANGVPEPAGAGILLTAAGLLVARRRRPSSRPAGLRH